MLLCRGLQILGEEAVREIFARVADLNRKYIIEHDHAKVPPWTSGNVPIYFLQAPDDEVQIGQDPPLDQVASPSPPRVTRIPSKKPMSGKGKAVGKKMVIKEPPKKPTRASARVAALPQHKVATKATSSKAGGSRSEPILEVDEEDDEVHAERSARPVEEEEVRQENMALKRKLAEMDKRMAEMDKRQQTQGNPTFPANISEQQQQQQHAHLEHGRPPQPYAYTMYTPHLQAAMAGPEHPPHTGNPEQPLQDALGSHAQAGGARQFYPVQLRSVDTTLMVWVI